MQVKNAPAFRFVVRAVACVALLCVLLSRASGQIVSTTGLTEISPPPASVEPEELVSNTEAFIFRENADFQLTADLNIDASETGEVSSIPATPGSISAATSIESFYLHFDKIGSSSTFVEVNGSVEFGRDILGIIFVSSQLDETDSVLGVPTTLYPTSDPSRGIIGEFGTDSFTAVSYTHLTLPTIYSV